ncbi:hypothetical protein CCACVL1_29191, partial [Corchorus capsularis]
MDKSITKDIVVVTLRAGKMNPKSEIRPNPNPKLPELTRKVN